MALACGVPAGDAAMVEHELGVGEGQENAADAGGPGFLELMADAPFLTAYQGVRRVHMRQTVRDQTGELEYREDVACDGAGNFDVDCLDLTGGGLSDDDRELFLLMQDLREGFVLRYRDFRIRDLVRCLESHAITLEGGGFIVAGVSCERIRVERIEGSTFYYLAWVDPQTGLVLRWEQRALDHLLLAEVEFESLVYQPDLSGRQLRGPSRSSTSLKISRNRSASRCSNRNSCPRATGSNQPSSSRTRRSECG
jgi:hypothetical protein